MDSSSPTSLALDSCTPTTAAADTAAALGSDVAAPSFTAARKMDCCACDSAAMRFALRSLASVSSSDDSWAMPSPTITSTRFAMNAITSCLNVASPAESWAWSRSWRQKAGFAMLGSCMSTSNDSVAPTPPSLAA